MDSHLEKPIKSSEHEVNPQKEGILRIGDKNRGSYPQKWAILRI
jgi:hypothetical protein